ncbi:PAS domain S-box protein [Halosimplex sp. J119]
MGSSGSSPDIAPGDITDVFSRLDEPSTPLTAAEIATELGCEPEATRRQLDVLVDNGRLHVKQVSGSERVWWRPADRELSDGDERPEAVEFSAFVSAVKDYAIFMLDPDGTVANWNDGAERIKGYRESEIVGEHFSTFYTESDVADDVPAQNLEAARRNGRVEDEGWRVRADGTRFWASVVITAVRDEDGELQGFTKVTRDMTERREYEQELREKRDLVERVLDTVPVGIGVLDGNGKFVRANPQMLEQHGLDPSDMDEYDLYSLDVYDSDGDPLTSDEWPLSRVLETGEPIHSFECQIQPPGEPRQWFSINAAPLERGPDNEQVVVAVDDITERKERERQIRRERDQTEQLLRTAPIAIAVQDAEGDTVLANERAQNALGLSEQEGSRGTGDASEWTVYDASGEPLTSDEMPAARVLRSREPVLDEMVSIDPPDGDRMQFRINAAPIFDADGEVERVITAAEDVTRLKEREQQLERRKTELETELSEILGRISDAFFALDDEWRFTHLNDRAADIMDRSREALIGEVLWDAFPDSSGVYREHFERAMDTQEPVTFEVYFDVSDSWLEFNVYPSESGLSIYFRDVTERIEREQELAKYETIVETVEDGIYVKDEEGQFTMVNESYAELTGYDVEELVGANASLVVDEDTIQQAKDRKRAMSDDPETDPAMEAMIERADGSKVPTEGTFATIETGDGEIEQVGVVRDISDRKEYERKIEESERRYRTLAENFPNGIVALFDDDLRYVAAGGELVGELEIEGENAIGETVYDRYPADLLAEIEPHFEAALAGEANSFEIEFYGRHLRAHTLPIDPSGDDRRGMLVVQDITERKEYQRRLEESNERLQQFAYAASHDLQEPLRMVSSYLQLVEDRYADALDDDGREFIEYAVDGAERMRAMIEGLLEYSRVETQGDPFEPVALDDVLADVRADLQVRIEETDADIDAEPLPEVEGDAGQLRQVFQNLLDNAIEYSGDEPPDIAIGAEREGDEWVISVSDEGIGIDPDDSDRVFEVFQRLHSREDHAGTGIGLALCRRIVDRHGGEIWVDSDIGAGATFRFTLPVASE